MIDDKIREEIEKRGYTIVGVSGDPRTPSYYFEVMKDGFYGLVNGKNGEEETPCVNLSVADARKDIALIGKPYNSKKIGTQKILLDLVGEQYDPYLGKVTKTVLEILGLPISDGEMICLKEEEFKKVVFCAYQLIKKKIENGNIQLLVYDHGPTREFESFCHELEILVNGEELYSLNYANYDLSDEDEKKLDEHNYISFSSKLEQRILQLRTESSSPFGLNANEIKVIGAHMNMKPALLISAEEMVYYPDISALDKEEKKIEISAAAYKKGPQFH